MILLEEWVKILFAAGIPGLVILLLIISFIIFMVKKTKLMKKFKTNNVSSNQDEKPEILKCFGDDNIIEIKNEMSRITVTVKNIELVDGAKLQEQGAKGVLFVGNQVKCSFENAKEIYESMSKYTNE